MSRSIQIERIAADWLARHDADTWTVKEQAQLDAWLSASSAHRVAYIRLDAAWRQSARLKALGAGLPAGEIARRGQSLRTAPTEHSIARTSEHFGESGASTTASAGRVFSRPRRAQMPRHEPGVGAHGDRRLVAWLLAASAFVLAIFLGGIWRHYTTVEQAAYATAVGSLRSIALADGSQVTLSSNSRVQVAFSRHQRRISLQQGEAFFKVAKDAGRPFVVTAGNRRVIAVGTRFDVRRDSGSLRVVVTRGLVRLESGNGADGQPRPTAYLPAGSIAVVSDSGVVVNSETVQAAEQYANWRSGFLSFHDTPLSDAVAEFNRYNTRQIVIGDKQTAAVRVGGNFRWSNADAFVRLLQLGFAIRAEHHGTTIVLHRRQESQAGGFAWFVRPKWQEARIASCGEGKHEHQTSCRRAGSGLRCLHGRECAGRGRSQIRYTGRRDGDRTGHARETVRSTVRL